MIERKIAVFLKDMAGKYPVVTVTGPRQAGKTTLVRNVFKERAYINLENPEEREFAQNDPRGFLRKIPNGAVLDEIQRTPELLSYIQTIVDEQKKNGLFILTGSQQFEIMRSISQSLAGRTAILKLLPFSFAEIHGRVQFSGDVNEIIYKGFYPRVHDQRLDPNQAYGDYFETYVTRDLRQLIAVKNLSQFQKFVRLCAGRIGQLLNLNSLGNETGISHTTAREWLTLLEASFIVFLMEPFFQNIGKRLIKSPKIYFYDVGLASYLLGIEQPGHLEHHPLKGNLFENLVVMEVLKYRFNHGKRNNLNFFRDSAGNEVDLLYSVSRNMLAMEIKSAETIHADFFKGLRFFDRALAGARLQQVLIYGGQRQEIRNGIQVIPLSGISDLLDQFV